MTTCKHERTVKVRGTLKNIWQEFPDSAPFFGLQQRVRCLVCYEEGLEVAGRQLQKEAEAMTWIDWDNQENL